jgi:hypothetical protein
VAGDECHQRRQVSTKSVLSNFGRNCRQTLSKEKLATHYGFEHLNSHLYKYMGRLGAGFLDLENYWTFIECAEVTAKKFASKTLMILFCKFI